MNINITESHVDEAISALNAAKPKILETIGLKAEK